MPNSIDVRELTHDLLRQGEMLRHREGFLTMPETVLEDGSLCLRARVRDAFNFVDHPRLVLTADGSAVSDFQCDCPAYRQTRGFCVHCAALLEGRTALPVMHSQAAPVQVLKEDAAVGAGEPCIRDFSYCFANSARDLYPGIEEPRIPEERFFQVFGRNAQASAYYDCDGEWGGSCFGFVSSSTLLHQPDGNICLADFSDTARFPSELSLADVGKSVDMTLHELIEAVQILQYAPVLAQAVALYNTDAPCLEKLAQRVRDYQIDAGDPVLMGMFSDRGGHAVLPFHIETVDSQTDRLHIYDPNYPMEVRYAALEKNFRGEYVNWRFPMTGSVEFSSSSDSELTVFPYEAYKLAWENCGVFGGATLGIDWDTELWDDNGTMLVCADANKIQIFDKRIFAIHPMGKPKRKPALTLPSGGYLVKRLKEGEHTARMADVNLSVCVTSQAREIAISVSDSASKVAVEIPVSQCGYAVTLLDTKNQQRVTYALQDTTQEGLQLMYLQGRIYARGLTANAQLLRNGEPVAICEHVLPLVQEEAVDEEYLIFNGALDSTDQPQD